ncbi:MAG: molecular chaperone [Halanaeroarchaeum sp.]
MAATTQPEPSFARARSHLYDLLAAVFDGDVDVLARAMRDDAFVGLAGDLPGEFETAVFNRSDLDEEALSVGYDNLFVVPGPYYVPPFASAHLDDPSQSFESDSPYHEAGEAGELFGDPAARVVDVYEGTGFEPERGDGIPDHVAAELEFMAAVTAEEAWTLEAADPPVDAATLRERQREMLGHLSWLDRFADAVAESDATERLFAGVAAFAAAFVAWDAEQVRAAAD